jgi:hypothetical protein
MRERLFNSAKKIAGAIGVRIFEDRRPLLLKLMRRANLVDSLMHSDGWPVVPEIIDDFRQKIADELGRKLLTDAELHRLNHRMELIKELEQEFTNILREGETARREWSKLQDKEKRNAG